MARERFRMKALIGFAIVVGLVARADARTTRVAIPGFGAALIALTVVQEKGYYRQEGLEVEQILTGAGLGIQSLIAGEVDFAGATVPGLNAAFRGAPLRVIFASLYRPLFWLLAKQDIRDIRALKGKKIGLNAIGGADDFVLRDFLKKNGLEGGRDVVILGMGLNPTRLAALINGAVDAAVLQTPFNIRAEEAGFRELVDFTKENIVDLGGGLVTTEALIKSDPGRIHRFSRAVVKGLIHARENRSAAVSALVRDVKISEAIASKTYDQIRPVMTPYGAVSDEMQREALEFLFKVQGIPWPSQLTLERYFDFSFVRKAHAELQSEGWTGSR